MQQCVGTSVAKLNGVGVTKLMSDFRSLLEEACHDVQECPHLAILRRAFATYVSSTGRRPCDDVESQKAETSGGLMRMAEPRSNGTENLLQKPAIVWRPANEITHSVNAEHDRDRIYSCRCNQALTVFHRARPPFQASRSFCVSRGVFPNRSL